MDVTSTLEATEAAALDILTAIEWFRRLATHGFYAEPEFEGENIDDLNGDLALRIAEVNDLLIGSAKRIGELLDSALPILQAANTEPITLQGKTAESVVEVVEELAYDTLRDLAAAADDLLWKRSVSRRELLLTLSGEKLATGWEAVRERISNAPSIDRRALTVAIRKERLRAAPRTSTNTIPAAQEQAVGTIPAEQKAYLTSWTEILSFLEMTPDKKRWLVKANERYDGPIIPGEQGEQPFCECGELRRWYSSLAERLRQISQHKRDRQATVADKYKYGRDGTVVPEISGAVKNRRRDAKR